MHTNSTLKLVQMLICVLWMCRSRFRILSFFLSLQMSVHAQWSVYFTFASITKFYAPFFPLLFIRSTFIVTMQIQLCETMRAFRAACIRICWWQYVVRACMRNFQHHTIWPMASLPTQSNGNQFSIMFMWFFLLNFQFEQ